MYLYLNCIDNEFSLNKKQYLLKAAERLGITNVKEYSIRVPREESDYVLNIEPYSFVKGNKWTGIWEIDILLDRREMEEANWEAANTIYLALTTIPPRFKKFEDKIKLLLQAVDPQLHRYNPKAIKDCDLIINGADHEPVYSERRRVWEMLQTNFKTKKIERVKLSEYMSAANSAKVQFIRSMNTPLANGELAQRFFEYLAVGPVLTNYAPELVETGLVSGRDYLSYSSDAEMIYNLRYLLNNPDEAAKMSQKGRDKVNAYHLYDHRLVSILNDINNHSS